METGILVIGCIAILIIGLWSFFSGDAVDDIKNSESLGVFSIDNMPLPPNNCSSYFVYGIRQSGNSHGTDRGFISCTNAASHAKSRLNRSSFGQVRVYRNSKKGTVSYHRLFYSGKGSSEGKRLGQIVIAYK